MPKPREAPGREEARARLNPALLRWARESAGYSLEEAAKAIGVSAERLIAAEAGSWQITLRQAEKAAHRYERPMATFYLPEPPHEETAAKQYRRLPDSPPPPWPKELRSLARRVRERQSDTVELYELLEEPPPWPTRSFGRGLGADRAAELVRVALGVSIDEQRGWRDRTGYKPLRRWLDAVEALGVLVIQDGAIPLTLARGFASVDPIVPAIVLNTEDDARARIFTLFHEFGHLLTGSVPRDDTAEGWCDSFSASILMPAAEFTADFEAISDDHDLPHAIDAVASTYGVTPDAAAVRVGRLDLAPFAEVRNVRQFIAKRGEAARRDGSGGGDYYRTQLARTSPSFAALVFAALDGQALTYSAASRLLNVKVNNFGRFRSAITSRSAG